ncbi:GntR family transcriptional regulator [Roseomonas sp. SSH11]|uniref:GntR family transcriptional regulator n=1 Tax=Pararoseomonas baculiformis TaxID=2820812 RepID=A0ABS4ADK9_9PROT|nr:GntR family transcriptional regulator [Pararoseomonas baculiformis]MBP0445101.1 GntR family transcriptional regulator [Pararoseomonas baculiformis]
MASRTRSALLRAIEQDLDEGRLKPGDSLDEQGLASRFEVSRTPAREALLYLEAKGVVRMVPRRGAVVQDLTPTLALGMVELLTALESEAAGLAARRMVMAERQVLQQQHEAARQMAQQLDSEAYMRANSMFHNAIYEGSRNAVLIEQLRATRRRMLTYHRSSLSQPARVRDSWQEHAALLSAILAGDESGARDAMREHIQSGGRVFADLVAGQQESRP